MAIKLIVGLGNPEPKYDRTRHNIGFTLVDKLAKDWGMSWQEQKKFKGSLAEGGRAVKLLKPLTYMNNSGQAIRAVVDWYKLTAEAVLVVYDDMDLPLGKIRLRQSGSSGGHNGIKSTIAHLGTEHFPRLRIGIGKSRPDKDTVSHVLGCFTPEETPLLQAVLQLASDAVVTALDYDITKSMNLYNNKNAVVL